MPSWNTRARPQNDMRERALVHVSKLAGGVDGARRACSRCARTLFSLRPTWTPHSFSTTKQVMPL